MAEGADGSRISQPAPQSATAAPPRLAPNRVPILPTRSRTPDDATWPNKVARETISRTPRTKAISRTARHASKASQNGSCWRPRGVTRRPEAPSASDRETRRAHHSKVSGGGGEKDYHHTHSPAL